MKEAFKEYDAYATRTGIYTHFLNEHGGEGNLGNPVWDPQNVHMAPEYLPPFPTADAGQPGAPGVIPVVPRAGPYQREIPPPANSMPPHQYAARAQGLSPEAPAAPHGGPPPAAPL
eukprot:2334183-Heterocapsa_arctica.AAC.1